MKSLILQFYELALKLILTHEQQKGAASGFWFDEVQNVRGQIKQLIASRQKNDRLWDRHSQVLEDFIASRTEAANLSSLKARDTFLQEAFVDLSKLDEPNAMEVYDSLALQALQNRDYGKHCVVRVHEVIVKTSCGAAPKGARVTLDFSDWSAVQRIKGYMILRGHAFTIYGPTPKDDGY